MSTRGSLVIAGKRHFISSDAAPSFARSTLKKAVRIFKQKMKRKKSDFIRIANKVAGFKWIRGIVPRNFGYPFEEFRWTVNLKTGKITGKSIRR